MKTKFYLNVRKSGSVRVSKTKVALHTDEIAVAMEIEIPNSIFIKPIISGKITVTEDMVMSNEIDADVKENIEKAIESVKGVTLNLIVENKEQ